MNEEIGEMRFRLERLQRENMQKDAEISELRSKIVSQNALLAEATLALRKFRQEIKLKNMTSDLD